MSKENATSGDVLATLTQFQLSALSAEQFSPLFELSDEVLAEQGAKRYTADAKPGYPCRVSLQDAEVGEHLILVPIVYHETDSPYRCPFADFGGERRN